MRIEEHLTTVPDDVDVVLDLSNVVRERGLCSDRPADLRRLFALIDGLKTYLADDTVQVSVVTDWSLERRSDLLSTSERRALRRWIGGGLIEARDGADDRVLEIADVTGAKVVSHDNFKGRHRDFPWIPGSADRFLRMRPDGDGIRVEARDIPIYPEHQLSSAEEHDLLRAAGLYDRERRLRREPLTRGWRCPVPDCPLFGEGRDGGQPLPAYRDGRVCCPSHRAPMSDLGRLLRPIQIKVSVNRTVVDRFLVTPGEPVTVGRELLRRVPPQYGDLISRRHAELAWDGQVLTVTDLNSRNGVRVKGRRLPPGRPERWDLRDAVALHEKVKLVVSGRHFVFDDAPATDDAKATGDSATADAPSVAFDAETRVHRGRR
ncbi:FHA domain-containing protein [Hamadaea sp. NPDC051192]|uniref:FHA domain-containing protein n=1 Tax=Hamadaea sp. NPDC051192 TaxID=3154940 RepID=UPI0034477849